MPVMNQQKMLRQQECADSAKMSWFGKNTRRTLTRRRPHMDFDRDLVSVDCCADIID